MTRVSFDLLDFARPTIDFSLLINVLFRLNNEEVFGLPKVFAEERVFRGEIYLVLRVDFVYSALGLVKSISHYIDKVIHEDKVAGNG